MDQDVEERNLERLEKIEAWHAVESMVMQAKRLLLGAGLLLKHSDYPKHLDVFGGLRLTVASCESILRNTAKGAPWQEKHKPRDRRDSRDRRGSVEADHSAASEVISVSFWVGVSGDRTVCKSRRRIVTINSSPEIRHDGAADKNRQRLSVRQYSGACVFRDGANRDGRRGTVDASEPAPKEVCRISRDCTVYQSRRRVVAVHSTATPDEEIHVQTDAFLDALADVALSVAKRSLAPGGEGGAA